MSQLLSENGQAVKTDFLMPADHAIIRKILAVQPVVQEEDMLVYQIAPASAQKSMDNLDGMEASVQRMKEAHVLSREATLSTRIFGEEVTGLPSAEYVCLVIPEGDLPSLRKAKNELDRNFASTDHHMDVQEVIAGNRTPTHKH